VDVAGYFSVDHGGRRRRRHGRHTAARHRDWYRNFNPRAGHGDCARLAPGGMAESLTADKPASSRNPTQAC
jgi:hypothetical protein